MSERDARGAAGAVPEQTGRRDHEADAGPHADVLSRLVVLAARMLGVRPAQVDLALDPVVPGSLPDLIAAAPGPMIVPDTAGEPHLRELPGVREGAVRALLGVPLRTQGGDRLGAVYCVSERPRTWSDTEVAMLEQLAASVAAELGLSALGRDLAASRARLELAMDAAGIGSFDWDLQTGRLVWDDRLQELFGYADGEFGQTIESFDRRLHPDDLPRVREAIREAVERCGEYEAEFRVVAPGRRLRWVQARGRVLCDEPGRAARMMGAAYDTTAQREGEARLASVLESMPNAFFSVDHDWRFTYVNADAERLLGRRREELLGGDLWQLFPLASGSDFEDHYRTATRTGAPVTFEAYYPPPLDAWYEVRAWPGPDGLSVYFHDITERRLSQQQAERAAARAALRAQVASALSSTLDAEEAVGRLAHLVVPTLGEWCIVTLVEDGPGPVAQRLRDIGWWHEDARRRDLVEQYMRTRLRDLGPNSFVSQALATGHPVVRLQGAAEAIMPMLSGDAREAFAQLRPDFAAVLPLRAHGRLLGLLTLYDAAGSPRARDRDLDTAIDVAARAGLALENARLYDQQRQLAEQLQRSLLTAPPEPPGLHIAVRYQPAAEVAQVGGDWYDAFRQRDGATVLVIGDVVGHDTQAAAAMGQLRGLLRGVAATGGAPGEVLTRLDDVLQVLDVETTATAVVARIEPAEPAEPDAGGYRLRWSNAGHPPPVVVEADGSVRVLGEIAGFVSDLLLGIDPRTGRTEKQVGLPPGSTVLLYTDGLIERRGQSLDDGLARLQVILGELAGHDLDEMCDALLARMLPERAEDDVALAAVRIAG